MRFALFELMMAGQTFYLEYVNYGIQKHSQRSIKASQLPWLRLLICCYYYCFSFFLSLLYPPHPIR